MGMNVFSVFMLRQWPYFLCIFALDKLILARILLRQSKIQEKHRFNRQGSKLVKHCCSKSLKHKR